MIFAAGFSVSQLNYEQRTELAVEEAVVGLMENVTSNSTKKATELLPLKVWA